MEVHFLFLQRLLYQFRIAVLGHVLINILILEILIVLLRAYSNLMAKIIFRELSKLQRLAHVIDTLISHPVSLFQVFDEVADRILKSIIDEQLPFRAVFVRMHQRR